ncbi:cobaltochelatase subunit CobN [Pelagibaculum spongiae]|uniref:Cobalamin biosynthesis protein CobN n=1 Tax=Pelagibaculum spongiae TaxID=2080658 RepID=A0A2V1H319_9GAMM|nr:cobaltochelatase subunit CobN [Pelagibaculum spongiae]PVZ71567.1 cobalamin biosynthesis protein CobN [Pelagibaculum spongiae]
MRNFLFLFARKLLVSWFALVFFPISVLANVPLSVAPTTSYSGLAIVSDRSAAALAAATHRYLEQFPDQKIQLRSVSQVQAMDQPALLELIKQSDQLLIASVFGELVERLLAMNIQNDSIMVINSDHRLLKLNRQSAQVLPFESLSAQQKKKLFSKPTEADEIDNWLKQQQIRFPEFSRWLLATSYWRARSNQNVANIWRLLITETSFSEQLMRFPPRLPASVRYFLQARPYSLAKLANQIDWQQPILLLLDHDAADRPGDWALHQQICKATSYQCLSVLAGWGQPTVYAISQIQQLFRQQQTNQINKISLSEIKLAVVSLQDFVLGGGEGRLKVSKKLQQLNVPVLKGIRLTEYSYAQWKLSSQGLPADSVHYRVAMPELQGVSQPLVLAATSVTTTDSLTGLKITTSQPIAEQIDYMLRRINGWLSLSTKANQQKRVALIYYNHPPGRHNIGADNLNVVDSLWQMLVNLQAQGYQTGTLPETPQILLDLLQQKGVNLPQDKSALAKMSSLIAGVSSDDYQQWFSSLPQPIQQEMVDGPLGWLTAVVDTQLVSKNWQQKQAKQLLQETIFRTLEDLRHVLDGVRSQNRQRALSLLVQVKQQYQTMLVQSTVGQAKQIAQEAKTYIRAIVDLEIEGLRGWGEAPGYSMVWQDRLLIPGVQFGNIFVGPQPPRGWELNEELLHANMSFPPPHQYMAFYYYLKNHFKADALVHVGRHSTYEFLPRKSLGLDANDYSRQMVAGLPSIYPYIVDGVGEGIQAKRRGMAVMIDHLTPPLAVTELYDGLLSLRQLIESAEAASDQATVKRAVVQIRQKIEELNLRDALEASMDEELQVRGIGFDQVEDDFLLHEVGHYLTKLQESFMPLGLHIFGKPWKKPAIDTMLQSMIGGSLAENAKGQSAALNKEQQRWKANLQQSPKAEMDSFINALNGGFVAPAKGNDPIKTPEVLPTGRNFHALDSSLLPTPLGYQLGAELAAKARENQTPAQLTKKEAVILWASDAVRDEGAMIAFALDMLGVKPIWNSRGIVKQMTLVPLTPQRPNRHDVLLTTSGLFRDLYGKQILWLDQAVLMALAASGVTIQQDYPALSLALNSALQALPAGVNQQDLLGNEPLENNLVAANWLDEARLLLRTSGGHLSQQQIGRQASLRIFGTAPGAYGAGINRLVERSGSWDDRQQLGQAYITRMGHAYGINAQGISAQKAFSAQLEKVGKSYLGRASNLYGLIDNNDAFDYLGGLNLAIETVTGKAPDSFVIQHASAEKARLDPLQLALTSELRGRFFNPQWIKPLMKQGYAGARTMGSEFIEYLWGWQVTSPEMIKSWVWDEVKAVYIDDQLQLGLDDFLQQGHNQQVTSNILAVMLIAAQKGFWQTDQQTLKQLANQFAESIVKNGIPGSGHTHANHPIYQNIQNYLAPALNLKLQAVLDASRLPEQSQLVSSPITIQEIQLNQPATDNKLKEDNQNQLATNEKSVNQQLNKPLSKLKDPKDNSTISEDAQQAEDARQASESDSKQVVDQPNHLLIAAVVLLFLLMIAGIAKGRRGI